MAIILDRENKDFIEKRLNRISELNDELAIIFKELNKYLTKKIDAEEKGNRIYISYGSTIMYKISMNKYNITTLSKKFLLINYSLKSSIDHLYKILKSWQ